MKGTKIGGPVQEADISIHPEPDITIHQRHGATRGNPLVTVGLSWFAEEEREGVSGGVERRGIEIISFLS